MNIKFPSTKKIKKSAEAYADALNLTGTQREVSIQDLTAGAKWMKKQIKKQLK